MDVKVPTRTQLEKLDSLRRCIREFGSVAVAFSGGVDSTFLVKVAHDELGDKAIAVTAKSASFPERELKETMDFCEREGIRQIICHSEELDIDGFCENPKNRCYLCKKELFTKINALARENNIAYVLEGSNMDDLGDYRPGLMAVEELGVMSPLRGCQLSKADIRALSRYLGLQTWEKPSFACLASRFVYGESITEERLSMVDKGEQFLLDMGFKQVRVRIHGSSKGTIARIEIGPEEFELMMSASARNDIAEKFKEIGFTYVAMDLTGYRTGSMNETLGE